MGIMDVPAPCAGTIAIGVATQFLICAALRVMTALWMTPGPPAAGWNDGTTPAPFEVRTCPALPFEMPPNAPALLNCTWVSAPPGVPPPPPPPPPLGP